MTGEVILEALDALIDFIAQQGATRNSRRAGQLTGS
jgi:hypothetical protein